VIVLDTSVIYALLDARDQRHREARDWYEGVEAELTTTPLVLAEVDHLAGTRAGTNALRAFRRDIVVGAYAVEWWPDAANESIAVAERYEALGLGLADASLVCLAARHRVIEIATFDERHFRAIQPLVGDRAFKLLPVDAQPRSK